MLKSMQIIEEYHDLS